MTTLFDRYAEVTFGPRGGQGVMLTYQEGSNLNMSFSVRQSITSEINTARVSLYGLSDTTRAVLDSQGVDIAIMAGYRDAYKQIYLGDVMRATHTVAPPDTTSDVEAGDGARALRDAVVSVSYKAGTLGSSIIRDIIALAKIEIGSWVYQPNYNLLRPFADEGKFSDIMDRLAAVLNFDWSIQFGQLYIIQRDRFLQTPTVPVISPDSGLVGSPVVFFKEVPVLALIDPEEKQKAAAEAEAKKLRLQTTGSRVVTLPDSTDKGIRRQRRVSFQSFLNGDLRPGYAVVVDSRYVKGQFKIESVTHTGQTSSGQWTTDVEAIAIE